ncbi:MAG: hypothetical protein WC776_04965, partial [Patescibacteria group bacterium]
MSKTKENHGTLHNSSSSILATDTASACCAEVHFVVFFNVYVENGPTELAGNVSKKIWSA